MILRTIIKTKFDFKKITYINPIDPAVKPIMRKNENSAKSLGKELTITFS